jgi:hypothetical protein
MGGRWYRGMSADNLKGLALALSSSLFIGASFIIKKKGLKKAAASSSGVRAGNRFLLLMHDAQLEGVSFQHQCPWTNKFSF